MIEGEVDGRYEEMTVTIQVDVFEEGFDGLVLESTLDERMQEGHHGRNFTFGILFLQEATLVRMLLHLGRHLRFHARRGNWRRQERTTMYKGEDCELRQLETLPQANHCKSFDSYHRVFQQMALWK